MLDDDLLRLINDVAANVDKDADRAAIEAWIDQIVGHMGLSFRHTLHAPYVHPEPQIADRIAVWLDRRDVIVSNRIAAAARILLRRELLGE